MMPFSDVAVAVLVAWNAVMSGAERSAPRAVPSASDSVTARLAPMSASLPSGLTLAMRSSSAPDTVPRRPRQKATVYSDGYGTRLSIHRRLSWAMLPLFAASYFSGDQILNKGSEAPSWARNLHRPAATGSALLFTAQSVTGYWNQWEARHDKNHRKRRLLHGALFTAASAGFVYAGTQLADEAEQSDAKRRQHRNLALGSIGLSTSSWLLMLLGN